jgi:hypothetical protein
MRSDPTVLLMCGVLFTLWGGFLIFFPAGGES